MLAIFYLFSGNRNIVIESELEASPIVPHTERIQEQLHSFEGIIEKSYSWIFSRN